MWLNPSDSFVDILEYDSENGGQLINFISESGVLEFFIFASASSNSPKKISKILGTITGF